MARYMFLYHGGAPQAEGLAPAAIAAHLEKWDRWVAELAAAGAFEGGEALDLAARTVTADAVRDGPFVETKELIGGFAIIRADSLEAAAEIARGCPIYEFGGRVEVRPLRADHCMDVPAADERAA